MTTVRCGQYDLTTEAHGGQSTGCQQAVIFVSNDLKIAEVGYSSGQRFPWAPGRLRFVSLVGVNRVMAEETPAGQSLVFSLAEKVHETVERTDHLVSLVPGHLLGWRPELPPGAAEVSELGQLLGHLLDCLSGFCAAFYRAFPTQLADFEELRSITVNQSCAPFEARAKIKLFEEHIRRGFKCCTDEGLATKIPTMFVPEGATLLTVLLGNLEHLTNHKYQLFFYLKLAGVTVGSRDIYTWRGVSASSRQATVEPE
jgi:hypothetical protein